MKLSLIAEGHWKPVTNHPGKLGGKGKRDMSFLVQPSDRKKFLSWWGKQMKKNAKNGAIMDSNSFDMVK